jgi:hypothetical protein
VIEAVSMTASLRTSTSLADHPAAAIRSAASFSEEQTAMLSVLPKRLELSVRTTRNTTFPI